MCGLENAFNSEEKLLPRAHERRSNNRTFVVMESEMNDNHIRYNSDRSKYRRGPAHKCISFVVGPDDSRARHSDRFIHISLRLPTPNFES
eukprot:scaffold6420_cov168-Amphora_coffeaeformis.AAC.19